MDMMSGLGSQIFIYLNTQNLALLNKALPTFILSKDSKGIIQILVIYANFFYS